MKDLHSRIYREISISEGTAVSRLKGVANRQINVSLLILLVAVTTGCTFVRVPTLPEARDAASDAIRDPHTWVPLIAATASLASNADARITEWAVRERPIFDERSERWGDALQYSSFALYSGVLFTEPRRTDRESSKFQDLGFGFSVATAQSSLSWSLKKITGRERPDQTNHQSFPSGHSGGVSAMSALTRQRLHTRELSQRSAFTINVGLTSMSMATAWSRVEAGKHHFSDVLVGYAVGNFVAVFMDRLAKSSLHSGVNVDFINSAEGPRLTMRIPIGMKQR